MNARIRKQKEKIKVNVLEYLVSSEKSKFYAWKYGDQ
jgi:hypothetical protein